jgi:branched-chain amino acid transport system ATP-binding protein
MPMLEIKQLTKKFGGLVALDGFNMGIKEGEIIGLIGPNGAGKSTALATIAGFQSPTSGKVLLCNEDITGWKPYRVASRGLIRTFQASILFNEMTVMQNTVMGCHLSDVADAWSAVIRTRKVKETEEKSLQRAVEMLRFVGLDQYMNEIAKNLSQGHQRALSIAIGLAAGPKIILLDEPATGMNAAETRHMMDVIQKMRSDLKVTVLLVEHNMRVVMNLCDRIVVLNFGKKIAEGCPDDIKHNDACIQAYLGEEIDAAQT